MKIKSLMGAAVLASLIIFASCNNSSKENISEEVMDVTDNERQAYDETVELVEKKLDAYLNKIDIQLEAAEAESKEELQEAKAKAEEMKLVLQNDYKNYSEASAEKWAEFKNKIEEFIIQESGSLADLTKGES